MKKATLNENTLYSNEEFRHIVFIYQQLLNMLIRELPHIKKDLNIKGSYKIMDIKRGLKNGSQQVFWDYLASPHGNMEDLLHFDKNSTFRCIKIIFHSGESITLINNPKMKFDETTGKMKPLELPKGILCLDNYRKKLNNTKTKEFDDLCMELSNLEKNHFSSGTYKESIYKIINFNADNLINNIYKDKLASLLNLQSE